MGLLQFLLVYVMIDGANHFVRWDVMNETAREQKENFDRKTADRTRYLKENPEG